jgi:hypothetical protein
MIALMNRVSCSLLLLSNRCAVIVVLCLYRHFDRVENNTSMDFISSENVKWEYIPATTVERIIPRCHVDSEFVEGRWRVQTDIPDADLNEIKW